MIHRHITSTDWSKMAIESLFDRGTLDNWREFAGAVRTDPGVAERALEVSSYREPDGSEGLARTLVEHFQPAVYAKFARAA